MSEDIKLRTLPEVLEQIKETEQLRLEAYHDGAGWSIGYGHFFGAHVEPPFTTITKEDAETLFLKDMEDREKQLNYYLKATVTDTQYSALMDLTFNAGIGHALQVINFINQERVPEAIETWKTCAISTYNFKDKKVETSQALIDRRKNEIALFETVDKPEKVS